PQPLGEIYQGTCHADTHTPFSPGDETLRDFCNIGYARRRCSRFPANAQADAVRFAITSDGSGVIRIQYATEVDHLPGPHGLLEYSRASGAFSFSHADRLIQRQAEAYLSSYLRRKPHAS